jgi:hypothetical protein
MVAKRCDALLELHDLDGKRVWKGVLRAVQKLVRVERKAEEASRSGIGGGGDRHVEMPTLLGSFPRSFRQVPGIG